MFALDPRTLFRVGVWCVAGLLAVAVVLHLRPAPEADPCDAACHASAQATKRARETHYSARAVAVAAETVYVARRAQAQQKVAVLPEPKIVGKQLVIGEGVYDVPEPVALFVMQQHDAIQAQAIALVAADSLLAKFRVERVASDELEVARERETAALRGAVQKASHTGRWDRVAEWGIRAGIAYGAYRVGQAVR